MKAIFDARGICTSVTDGDPPDDAVMALDVPIGTSPNRIWYDGTDVSQREIADFSLPTEVIVGDPVSVSVPADSILKVNSEEVASSGTYDLDPSPEGRFVCEVIGRFHAAAAVDVVQRSESERRAERVRLKVHRLMTASPAQIDAYVDANVTDLASAREFLKTLAKLVVLNPR